MFGLTEEGDRNSGITKCDTIQKVPWWRQAVRFYRNGRSSVLKSDTAIEMNIVIMKTFISLRKLSLNYKEVMMVLEEMQEQYDDRFDNI